MKNMSNKNLKLAGIALTIGGAIISVVSSMISDAQRKEDIQNAVAEEVNRRLNSGKE